MSAWEIGTGKPGVSGPGALTGEQAEALEERLTDAVERVLDAHDMLDLGATCSCGARNNMDGDVLSGHRLGAVSEAIRAVIGGFFSMGGENL